MSLESLNDRIEYLKVFGDTATWISKPSNVSTTISIVFNILHEDLGASISDYLIQTYSEIASTIKPKDQIVHNSITYVISDVRNDGSNWLEIQMDRL